MRLQTEREIYQEQRRAAEESLKAEQDKLASIDERIQRERESTMSAAERFGLMTPEEQQQLLQARAQFTQGAANVDPESLRRLRGFSVHWTNRLQRRHVDGPVRLDSERFSNATYKTFRLLRHSVNRSKFRSRPRPTLWQDSKSMQTRWQRKSIRRSRPNGVQYCKEWQARSVYLRVRYVS